MPNQSPVQEVMIHPGMSEAVDARMLPLAPAARPRLVQNLRVRQGQRFEKRPGALTTSTEGLPTVGSACFVGEWNGVAVCGAVSDEKLTPYTNHDLYAHNGVASARWQWMGRYGACVPHRQFTVSARARALTTLEEGAVAVDGLLYVVSNDQSGAANYISVMEMTAEGTVLRTTGLASEDSPRLIWTGVLLLLITNAAGTVKIRTLNLTTYVFGAATNLPTAALATTTSIDASRLLGTNDWLLCYARTTTELLCLRLSGHSVVNSADVTTTSTPTLYSIAGKSGEKLFVVYADGAVAQFTRFDDDLTNASEVSIQSNSATEAWGTQFVLVRAYTSTYHFLLGGYDTSASTPTGLVTPFTYSTRYDVTGSPSSGWVTTKIWHFQPIAKPIALGDTASARAQVYCWCGSGQGSWAEVSQVRTVLLVFEQQLPWLAGLSYEHQHYINTIGRALGSVADLGDGRFATIIPWRDPGKFAGFDCAVFSLSLPATSVAQAHRFTETAGGSLLISGGILSDVTEAQERGNTYFLQENGFAHAPLVRPELAAGAGLTDATAYTYVACYRRIDEQGRVTRSPASAPVAVTTTTGNQQVTVYITTLGVSNRRSMAGETVVAEVYRAVNGGPYYYVGASTTVFVAAESISYTDAATDASIIDDDGTLDAEGAQPDAPSGARLLRVWGPRLGVVGWNEFEVQLSKYYRQDTGYEFVDDDAFRVRSPLPITALGWLDGAGVIFTKRKVLICTGDGPDDRGGGFFDEPRELAATVGADSPHVVEVPQGLIYKGAGTLWLLPRGFGPPQAIGDDIQETLASFPYLRSASRCSNPDDDVTHFVLASSDLPAATTKVAIWDNRLGAWSLDDIDGEVGAAGVVNGVFTWMLPSWDALADVPVRKLSTASTQDLTANGAASFIESRIGFGDWRPFGVTGWGNFRRLCVHLEAIASCIAKLDVSVDHGNAATVTKTFSAASGAKYIEYAFANDKGTALRVDLYDAQNSGQTAGVVWHGLSFEAIQGDGMRRVDGTSERFA